MGLLWVHQTGGPRQLPQKQVLSGSFTWLHHHQNRPSLQIWRDLLMCHLSKVFLAKCEPWWNDLSVCAQLENVYYCSNWSFIWNSKRLYATKSQNDATNNQILETPTLPQMTRLFSIFVHIQSLFLLLFSHFSKIEPLKSYGKCFFFSPKQLIWFLQYSNFRRKLGIEKQITTIYWYGMLKLPTLIFRKNQKPLQIKKKQLNKPSEHIWRYLKSGSWHF